MNITTEILEKYDKRYVTELIRALKILERFRLKGTRDHFIHSFNVYLVGSLCNLVCFSRLSNGRPLKLQWVVMSFLHDVGYVYEKLRKIPDEESENTLRLLRLVEILDPASKNHELDKRLLGLVREEIKRVLRRLLDKDAEVESFLNSLPKECNEKGVHGLASALFLYRYLFEKNPHRRDPDWEQRNRDNMALALLSHVIHSLGGDILRKSPLRFLGSVDYDTHRIVYPKDLYPTLLLLIMDEVCEFGRPAVVSKSKKSESRWVLENIVLDENNVLELRIKHNKNGNFFGEISKKILALAGEDGSMDNKIVVVLSNSSSRIINLRDNVKIKIMSDDSPPYGRSIIKVGFVPESTTSSADRVRSERQNYVSDI